MDFGVSRNPFQKLALVQRPTEQAAREPGTSHRRQGFRWTAVGDQKRMPWGSVASIRINMPIPA